MRLSLWNEIKDKWPKAYASESHQKKNSSLNVPPPPPIEQVLGRLDARIRAEKGTGVPPSRDIANANVWKGGSEQVSTVYYRAYGFFPPPSNDFSALR